MSEALEGAPAGLRRLFPHHRPDDLEDREHLSLIIGRLLEEGDSADLRWLISHHGEAAVADWVRRRGDRQLSPRSRAFWTLVLGLESTILEENPLWPT